MIRNAALDNTKILMVFLVVFGHLIEPFISENPLIKTIYLSIYSVHMPMFVLISGMLTKCDISKNGTRKIVTTILVPFVSFTVLYELIEFLGKGNLSNYTLNLSPYWILWFLYSLFLWKILLPIFTKIRYPIMLSVAIALLAGYIDSIGYFLGISRTLYYFPFFLIGHILTAKNYNNIYLIKLPTIILIGILVINPVIFWFFKEMPHQWLYGSFSYSRLESQGLLAATIRFGIYAISTISIVAIIQLMTTKELFISKKGEKTLFVYVWHGFFVKLFGYIGLFSFLGQHPSYAILSNLFLLALLLTFVLSTNFVSKNTYHFVLNPTRAFLPYKS